MKSLMSKTWVILGSVFIVFGFIACQNPADVHEHSYSTTWTSDLDYHWHAATCEHSSEISGKAVHTWNDGEVISIPSCTEKGSKKYTCTVCNATKNVETSENGHAYDAGVETKAPTCTEKGTKTYTCSVCSDTKTEDIAATGHSYDGIKCSKCGGYSITLSTVGDPIVDASKTDGLKLTLNTLTHTEVDGYNVYAINYTLKNEIPGSEVGPGIFKIIYKTSSGYDSSFQTGAFNNLYYNDTLTRSYSWKLTADKTFVCIEYIPDSLMTSYIFSDNVTDKLLNFVPAE